MTVVRRRTAGLAPAALAVAMLGAFEAVALGGGGPPEAASAGPPICARAGTRSEGWAWPDGRFIRWAKCKGVVPTCEKNGERGEGWYARGELIAAARCAQR